MNNNKIFRPHYRIRKAYSTAFKVIWSYLFLHLKGKFFGKQFVQKRLLKLHLKNAERVKDAILHLQGLFIKVGQSLSILTNFLPEAFHEPLEALQNEIPARPYKDIEKRIVKDLGDTPENLFAYFDKTPLASASIGQVHRARLESGEEVVVKVQHANIESVAEVDLRIIRRIIGIVSFIFKIKGIEHAYTQVQKMVEEELDFEKEATAMQMIAENLKDEPKLVIPQIVPEFSTHRVLTSQFCEGVKISNLRQLDEWEVDPKELGHRLVHAYCKMVFEDGVYHADPHPGNIMVQSDGTIVFLDFGAIGHLRPSMRTGFLALIDAAVKNDDDKIIASLNSMGFLSSETDAEQTAEKVIEAFRQFMQNEVQFDGLNLKDIKVNPFETSLFSLIKDLGVRGITNSVQVPKDFVLLNRMVSLLLGICNTLDSNMNPIDVLQPYFKQYVLGEQNMVQFVTDIIKGNVTNAIALPSELNKTLKKVQRGELELKLDGVRERNRMVYVLGQQFIFVIMSIVSMAFVYLFHFQGAIYFRKYAMIASGLFLFLLFYSMFKNRKMGQY